MGVSISCEFLIDRICFFYVLLLMGQLRGRKSNKILQTGLLFMANIGAGTYVFAALISLLTAAVAVTSKMLKAARANPADSLRYE